MKIAACLIVKDDSEVVSLKRSIDSIIKYVDSIYITATGKEVGLIEEFCLLNNLHYSYFPWCNDFAAARNYNFSQASSDTDYIYWQDADDILVGGQYLRPIAEMAKESGKDVVYFTYWYGCEFNGEPLPKNLKEVLMEHPRERLIKPFTNVWKGRLHETPIPVIGLNLQYSRHPYDENNQPIAVMHTSDMDDVKENLERNRKILEIQYKEEIDNNAVDPRTLLYLEKIYAEIGNVPENVNLNVKVIEMGQQYLSMSGWDMERGTCWEQMGIAYGNLSDHQKAADCFHKAIEEHPRQILYYIRLAITYFNLGKYDKAFHWLEFAKNSPARDLRGDMLNLKAIKVGYAEALMKLNFNDQIKNFDEALIAAKSLYKENPTENNKQTMLYLMDAKDLNDACINTEKICKYLVDIGQEGRVEKLLDTLPQEIITQPFAVKIRNKFSQPRKWADNEICYFANFGGKHFEKWDSSSLKTGIGGSETAVIELARQWTEMGYKVTIYGDPPKRQTDEYGISWYPWYYFNIRDYFNILIQWRGWNLASKVKTKKFFVDLHDVVAQVDYEKKDMRATDDVFVKSKYHREMLPLLTDNKMSVIGNGI